MAVLYVSDILTAAAPGAPFNAVWVRLVSNQSDGQSYISVAASDSSGNFNVANVPPGSYAIDTAPAQTGPWTRSGTQRYVVGMQIESTFAVSLTPAAVAANTTAEQAFNPAALAALRTNDKVFVNPPSAVAGLAIAHARVPSNGTLDITWANVTAGSLTPPAGSYTVAAIRS